MAATNNMLSSSEALQVPMTVPLTRATADLWPALSTGAAGLWTEGGEMFPTLFDATSPSLPSVSPYAPL